MQWDRIAFIWHISGDGLFMVDKKNAKLPVIGWREWVKLPELGVSRIKAKVDTGARTSSLHVYDLQISQVANLTMATFKIYPVQRSSQVFIESQAQVKEFRSVRSSSGKANLRPVIVTQIELMGVRWSVELTLANRDQMGFRMLLGREAFRKRFLVDAGSSYRSGKPDSPKKTKAKETL